MATRHTPLLVAIAAVVVAAGGYGLYLATAQSTAPVLAQSPLNITNNVDPAFIMAVDDSGSMNFQTLFAGRDGAIAWGRDSTSAPYSYFYSSGTDAGTPREAGTTGNRNVYVAPFAAPRQSSSGDREAAIPPFDSFGFARSPAFNRSYFDPTTSYVPWKRQDGTSWNAATATAARVHPSNTSPTINLTAEYRGTTTSAGDDTRFYLRTGMVMPAGTIYRGSGCNLTSSTSTWRTQPSDLTISGDCSVHIAYFPATFYLPEAQALPADFGWATNVTPPTIVNGCSFPGASGSLRCDLKKYEIKPANFATQAAYDAAIQNFANWFTYYGNRTRSMVAGMTNSLTTVNNLRVGYFNISEHASYDDPLNNTGERVTMYNMRDASANGDRVTLFNRITSMDAGGTTPNLSAVNAMGKQFQRTDSGAPVRLACQKNAGMLFTDGFTNESPGPSAPGITGLGVPFDTTYANSMAAIATRYYLNTNNTIGSAGTSNLRTGTGFPAGGVRVPAACSTLSNTSLEWKKLDCQTNLHMNFYGITLGARGEIFNAANIGPGETSIDLAYKSPYPVWPAHVNNSANTVDDIWHAAVNTRGEYINAKTPADITAAMRRILGAVGDAGTPAGTIDVSGARISTGSLSVQPRYQTTNNGTDWYGMLRADSITANATTGQVSFQEEWEASAKLAERTTARNIQFGRTTNSVVPAVNEFNATNVTLANLCSNTELSFCTQAEIEALRTGMDVTQAVAYLRGDRSLESGDNNLRTRTTILGDIINSSPVLSAPFDDYGYAGLGGTMGSSYLTYLESKRTANRPVVAVGANDGMFHVFDARTTSSGGNELFAYIPATALGHMGNLLFPYRSLYGNDQKFKHRYYVDGPVNISDAYFGGGWKTVAVGTSGAGGRSVFALDITNPNNISVLWEVNNLVTGNAGVSQNIGHVLGKPVIVPVKDASGTVSWKVIFGNGYNSANQQARLFIVDLATGSTSTILASESSPPAYNGLGNVVVVDRRTVTASGSLTIRDGYADTAYAADQNGAIWKFDLITQTVGLSGTPLFVARDAASTPNRQAITGGLEASVGPGGGMMIYFGTGSFTFEDDALRNNTQTLYGILDRNEAVAGRSALLQQTVGTLTDNFRATSTNVAATVGLRGWYLDLPSRERFVGNPRIESGIVFFPTYVPSAANGNDCSVAGDNFLYGLNSLTGGAALTYVRLGAPDGTQPSAATGAIKLDDRQTGSAPVKDVAVMTTPRVGILGAGASAAEVASALASRCSMVVRVNGADPMYVPRPCGRQSWRQVR